MVEKESTLLNRRYVLVADEDPKQGSSYNVQFLNTQNSITSLLAKEEENVVKRISELRCLNQAVPDRKRYGRRLKTSQIRAEQSRINKQIDRYQNKISVLQGKTRGLLIIKGDEVRVGELVKIDDKEINWWHYVDNFDPSLIQLSEDSKSFSTIRDAYKYRLGIKQREEGARDKYHELLQNIDESLIPYIQKMTAFFN
jgi:hypothetical protein